MNKDDIQENVFQWYALSQAGDVMVRSKEKKKVLIEDAYYIIAQTVAQNLKNGIVLGKFYIHDRTFQKTHLKYNGISCFSNIFYETYDTYNKKKHIRVDIADKRVCCRSVNLEAGLKSFTECISIMKELSKFDSWVDKDRIEENIKLNQEIQEIKKEKQILEKSFAELEVKNEELQKKLESIYESRNDLRRLTQLLFDDTNELSKASISPNISLN
jgi:hypothetical protein